MTDADARPVLLAIGDEKEFDAALEFAVREAKTRGTGLVLLHAYHVLPTGPETALLDFSTAERIATGTLTLAAEHATDVVAGRVELSTRLVRGPIVRSIVEASEECRLVVLQRRDLSHLSRVLTRSTSSGVAAHAHTPVAVVPEEWRGAHGGPTGVTVGVDVPARARAILRQAVVEARARRTTLRVLHTWWSPGFFDDLETDRVGSGSWTAEVADEIRGIVDELHGDLGDVPVSIETHHGRPGDTLVEASRSSALVVVGRHDPVVPVGSHLGPVARAVLRAAECPVLVVSPTGAHREG
ncbi:MAG: Universal stress protein [Nocardioides sp.]|nr:Universal stress protein [Nocardioides sp.]